jgi:hypothetical protein
MTISINKQLTLGCDFIGNDFLDLYIIDDYTIELYDLQSGQPTDLKIADSYN